MLPPADGEALSSWVDRLALAYDVELPTLWRMLGLLRTRDGIPSSYGLHLSDDELAGLVATTGISPAAIEPMLLRRFAGRWFDDEGLDTLSQQSWGRSAAWARTRWLYLWRSHGCPQCVGELQDPSEPSAEPANVWSVRWKLPTSMLCPTHQAFLIGACPTCGTRLKSVRNDARQAYQCCARLDSPAGQPSGTRRNLVVCETAVADMPAAKVQDPDLLNCQFELDQLLGPEFPAGEAAQRLAEIRRMLTLVLYIAPEDALLTTDPAVRERFHQHVVVRNDDAPRKENRAAAYRSYNLMPTDPLLAAAGLHLATRIVLADEPGELLEPFVAATMRDPWSKKAWLALDRFYTPPERLTQPLRRVRDHQHYAVHANLDGRTRHRSVGMGMGRADWRHVPQLAWEQVARTMNPDWFGGGWPLHQRRYISIALARTLSPDLSSYGAAIEALGLPDEVVSNAYRLSSRLRQLGYGPVFASWLEQICAGMAESDNLIDYARRRTELATVEILSDTDFKRILEQANVQAGKGWGRQEAATWLWVTITGGDFHLAPDRQASLLPRRKRDARYREVFLKQHLFKIERHLRLQGSELIESLGLPGPLEACPVGTTPEG